MLDFSCGHVYVGCFGVLVQQFLCLCLSVAAGALVVVIAAEACCLFGCFRELSCFNGCICLVR